MPKSAAVRTQASMRRELQGSALPQAGLILRASVRKHAISARLTADEEGKFCLQP